MPRRESWTTDHDQCCVVGLYVGGLFPLLCSLPEPASNPGVSLDENLRATEGGKDKTSLFFLLPMVSLSSKRFRSS